MNDKYKQDPYNDITRSQNKALFYRMPILHSFPGNLLKRDGTKGIKHPFFTPNTIPIDITGDSNFTTSNSKTFLLERILYVPLFRPQLSKK